ncbi:MAG: hypothetical protein A2172_00695 [Candidatus Woykebacteria bacterium RBG_13_40_15]|uniref:DUF4396 domain-containing protein n=1 Tax=Candidatus Woykebacteria bacterium RBG_13_40_15 TaxID=1802593 RepID=A0A1G1W8V7_9BACT|nr:MAG: hypothetical protein A2172_00695 [Candidatus Woykebacteria bacterium RBG_13_40_15]
MNHKHTPTSNFKLAFSATTHCLVGCGLGEVSGVIVGTIFGLTFIVSIALGIVAGFIFGYLLGLLPLLRAKMSLKSATKIVVATETASIAVMETGEVLTEFFFPGMMNAALVDILFWVGLTAALLVGFAAAFPVNLYLVRRGIRHQH